MTAQFLLSKHWVLPLIFLTTGYVTGQDAEPLHSNTPPPFLSQEHENWADSVM